MLAPFCLCAQSPYHHSFKVSSDNDSYTLSANDGYYTNGIRFTYSWNSQKDSLDKTIHAFQLGQLMYNAKNGSYDNRRDLDRPVTAFLYANYTQFRFNRNTDLFQWGLTLGTIGPPALGRQLQQSIHNLFNMYTPDEWRYQLKTEFGLNVSAKWSPSIWKSQRHFTIKPIAGATLGNTFTNANLGAAFLVGRFNDNSSTVFWGSELNQQQSESFFYFYPQIVLSAYNATIQGGLFRKDKGDFTGKLNRTLYKQQFGWMYSHRAFSMGLALIYESKESLTQLFPQWYGNITLGLSF